MITCGEKNEFSSPLLKRKSELPCKGIQGLGGPQPAMLCILNFSRILNRPRPLLLPCTYLCSSPWNSGFSSVCWQSPHPVRLSSNNTLSMKPHLGPLFCISYALPLKDLSVPPDPDCKLLEGTGPAFSPLISLCPQHGPRLVK